MFVYGSVKLNTNALPLGEVGIKKAKLINLKKYNQMITNNSESTNTQSCQTAVIASCGSLNKEVIDIIARKKALEYSYQNEYQYLKFVNAIKDGINIGLKNGKNI
jgi:hypothetical protein